MDIKKLYKDWLLLAVDDADLIEELKSIEGNEDEIFDRFYKELEFGTGGLRGVFGAGTNRMNIYTVAKATQGFANYINSITDSGKVAIAYDSRIKSDKFAKTAASVFAANGIKVYIYPELMPTPMLSFAVRELNCDAGVVVTASHNPSKYNGYKAYGPDGCQLNLEASKIVLDEVGKVDTFGGVKKCDFEEAIKTGSIKYISQDIIEAYLDKVQAQSINPEATNNDNFKVIYTPLNGAGNKPVRAILSRIGIKNVKVVPEQEMPDGNFPTAPYPNPEIRQAFDCALKLSESYPADLLLATDPDSDRVGIAVKTADGYQLMSGNQVGALLLDYILKQRIEKGKMPKDPITVKTIVTSALSRKISEKYGCFMYDVLTGFKFIGEIIGNLEKQGQEDRYIFGFEESYGYLSGSYVRDKDAVVASMLICEMACFYNAQGLSLIDVMNNLYKEHGFFCNDQVSFTCEGASGMQRMSEIMDSFRNDIPADIAGYTVVKFSDYGASFSIDMASKEKSEIQLPKSNVIAFQLDNGSSVIIRPSGTEPKIKVYIETIADSLDNAKALDETLKADISKKMGF